MTQCADTCGCSCGAGGGGGPPTIPPTKEPTKKPTTGRPTKKPTHSPTESPTAYTVCNDQKTFNINGIGCRQVEALNYCSQCEIAIGFPGAPDSHLARELLHKCPTACGCRDSEGGHVHISTNAPTAKPTGFTTPIDRFVKNALNNLYIITEGEKWYHSEGWENPNSDPCIDKWYGVTCEIGKEITRVDLSDNNLGGMTDPIKRTQLVALLEQIRNLEFLDITGNFGIINTTLAEQKVFVTYDERIVNGDPTVEKVTCADMDDWKDAGVQLRSLQLPWLVRRKRQQLGLRCVG